MQSASHQAPSFWTSRSGQTYLSVNQLDPEVREAFLDARDPLRNLKLEDNTVFYRATERQWVADGRLSGHPNCNTRIRNHLAVQENHHVMQILRNADFFKEHEPRLLAYMRDISAHQRYQPVEMPAHELPGSTLNVMVGPHGRELARRYGPSRMVVAMTLGDLRAAGGGEVFFDCNSVYRARTEVENRDGNESLPLIVTLPPGGAVPITDVTRLHE